MPDVAPPMVVFPRKGEGMSALSVVALCGVSKDKNKYRNYAAGLILTLSVALERAAQSMCRSSLPRTISQRKNTGSRMSADKTYEKVADWLVKTPLYEPIADGDDVTRTRAIRALITSAWTFDAYCIDCRKLSTFTPQPEKTIYDQALVKTKIFPGESLTEGDAFCARQQLVRVRATCARDSKHEMHFTFLHRRPKDVIKIGQYPSLADLSVPETQQFAKVLGQDRVRELNKGIGLAAHGVGVGSYIYLRRIFESLVEEAHAEAKSDVSWDDVAYQRSRMQERVELLKAHLPAFLVEHPQLYGILSKHVHELSEQECLSNFEAVKEAILIIARDKLKVHEEKENRERTAKLLQAINSRMSSGSE